MSDDRRSISRRRLLGGLGTLGAAGALGGGATTSLLWDEEKFGTANDPNVLQGGELDLKVDWEEHYVDWIGEETEFDARRIDSLDDLEDDEVPFPKDNPMIAVPADQADEFFESTIIESSPLTDQPGPVVTLEDVKPGDFGEVTLSYHVFDNPGFVSMCAEVHEDSDNGITEPEDKVNGHDPDNSDGTDGGDLGDHLQAQVFYDRNCDNLRQSGEIEVMFMTDVSESMEEPFPGTPDVDDNTGDSDAAGNNTRLEAVKAHMGNHPDIDSDVNLLSNIASCGGSSVEVGSVSAAVNLHHLDNLSDGDDSGAGFDDGGLDAVLDRALTKGTDPDDDANGAGDYEDLENLYGPGTDFSPDFVIEDPTLADDYEAERPYVEDGGTTVPDGIDKAHSALLPDGFVSAASGQTGIDPSGNADFPGEVRKLMVVLTDGKPGESTISDAQSTSDEAAQDSIDIVPVIINDSPTQDDIDYADALATPGVSPQFAADYTELGDELEDLETLICNAAGGGSESILAGPGPINDVLDELQECTLLSPSAVGVGSASEEFGGECHEPSITNCVALEWWLPYDIPGVNDNIVQTDRFEFQVSFEAVQCRHNIDENGEPIQTLPEADAENNAQHYN